MNDGRKNVPFALPDDDEQDVFSSVDLDRDEEVVSSAPAPKFRTSQGLPAVATSHPPAPSSAPAPGRAPTPAQSRHPRLTVEAANMSVARNVDIDRPLFLIGGEGAHLALQDDYVSQWHAQLRVEDGTVVLEDMGSANGVYLRIADDLQLEDGDEIVVGNQRFIFRTSWDPAPPAAHGPFAPNTPVQGGNLPPDAARLVQVYSGGVTGGIWRIHERVTIGRQNADVAEPDDPWLSSPHATIERRGTKFFIKDARSQYGTFIRVLDSVELIDGDCFVVGRSRIKITYP